MQAVNMGVAKANGAFATTFLSAILAGTCPVAAHMPQPSCSCMETVQQDSLAAGFMHLLHMNLAAD